MLYRGRRCQTSVPCTARNVQGSCLHAVMQRASGQAGCLPWEVMDSSNSRTKNSAGHRKQMQDSPSRRFLQACVLKDLLTELSLSEQLLGQALYKRHITPYRAAEAPCSIKATKGLCCVRICFWAEQLLAASSLSSLSHFIQQGGQKMT